MTAVTMTVRAESAAAKTAVADAAVVRPSPVRSGPAVRTAVVRPDESHRYRADRGRAHQRQHHAPRTFHGNHLCEKPLCTDSATPARARQAKADRFTASCGVKP